MKFLGSFLLSAFLAYCTISEATILNVTNSQEFHQVLDSAQPGDVITLQPGTGFLEGEFVAYASGNSDAPITITGADGASGFIKTNQGTGLSITGNYWRIEGIHFLITKPYIGVLISGNNNFISSALISGVQSGLQVTGNENRVEQCVISATDGPGLFVGGNNNQFESNVVSSPSELPAITVNGSNGQYVGDVYNGNVTVQGNSNVFYRVVMNNGITRVTGCDNTFTSVITQNPPDLTTQCENTVVQGISRKFGPKGF